MSGFKNDLEVLEKLKTLCGDDEELLQGMIEGETDLFGRVDRALFKYVQAKHMEDAIKNMIDELSGRKKLFQSRQERLKEFCAFVLAQTGNKSHEAPAATVAIKAVPPKPIIQDESKISFVYKKTVETIDKDAINKAIKDGVDVEGVIMDNGGQTIAIRVK